MSNQSVNQESNISIQNVKSSGFWKNLLLNQLSKIETGRLVISDGQNIHQFGSQGDKGISAKITVHKPSFYRKCCLGGSLGVADSFADGDWDTDDLVFVFRLFLQNQERVWQH